jgi:hypothetical protein
MGQSDASESRTSSRISSGLPRTRVSDTRARMSPRTRLQVLVGRTIPRRLARVRRVSRFSSSSEAIEIDDDSSPDLVDEVAEAKKPAISPLGAGRASARGKALTTLRELVTSKRRYFPATKRPRGRRGWVQPCAAAILRRN